MSMTWKPATGMRIESSLFGKGVVARVTPNGAVVRFDAFASIEIEQSLEHLRPDPDEVLVAAPSCPATVAPVSSPPPLEQVGAQQAVEALRFGLVPHHALEDLTLGFADLRAWIVDRLPDRHGGSPQVAAVFGPFGTGKSHTMAVIRHVAQREGYVTARVEVDGARVSLSEPERLLYALWQTLRAADWRSSTPLLDLYIKAIRAGHAPPSIAPRGIDRVRHNYAVARHLLRTGGIDEHGPVLDALLSSSDEFTANEVHRRIGGGAYEGYESFSVKRMIGNRVLDRPYDFVESLAGHATVARLAGYRGLIVTIDEFEVERAVLRAGYSRVRQLIEVLGEYLRGQTDHCAAPLGLFFATVGEAGHAGDTVIEQLLGGAGGDSFELHPWPAGALRELAERIYALYRAAYDLAADFDPALAERVADDFADLADGDGVIRAFIKRYVGALDAKHGPPWT